MLPGMALILGLLSVGEVCVKPLELLQDLVEEPFGGG